LLREEEK
jgi:hypothetical protein